MLDVAVPFPALVPLRTTGRMVRLSTDSEPSVSDEGEALVVGTELLRQDTGKLDYWTGTVWASVTIGQKLQQFVEVHFEIRDLLTKED